MTVTDATTTEDQPTLDGMPATPAAEVLPADSVPKAAPKRRGRPPRTDKPAGAAKASTTRVRRAAPPKVDIGARITDIYLMAGGALMMVPSPPAQGVAPQWMEAADGSRVQAPGPSITRMVGSSVIDNAPALGEAWSKVADENPQVREAIERLLTVSVWGALITAHLPIAIAAGVAAGAVPPVVAQLLATVKG